MTPVIGLVPKNGRHFANKGEIVGKFWGKRSFAFLTPVFQKKWQKAKNKSSVEPAHRQPHSWRPSHNDTCAILDSGAVSSQLTPEQLLRKFGCSD